MKLLRSLLTLSHLTLLALLWLSSTLMTLLLLYREDYSLAFLVAANSVFFFAETIREIYWLLVAHRKDNDE